MKTTYIIITGIIFMILFGILTGISMIWINIITTTLGLITILFSISTAIYVMINMK